MVFARLLSRSFESSTKGSTRAFGVKLSMAFGFGESKAMDCGSPKLYRHV